MGCREAEEVLIYDWNTRLIKHKLRREHSHEIVDHLEYFDDLDVLFCGGSNMNSLLWSFDATNSKTPQLRQFVELVDNVSSILLNKYDNSFFLCQYDKFLNIVNFKTGMLAQRHLIFNKRGDSLMYLPKNNIILATESKNLKIHFFSS